MMPMHTAITRAPSVSLADCCELTYVARQSLDFKRIQTQHQAYCLALKQAGVRVITLPSLDALPDSVFVEDAAIVLGDVAILTRPGAPSRQPEIVAMQPVLAEYRSIVLRIESPGTLDGGDVLQIGRRVFVGESRRTNRAGIEQLTIFAAAQGMDVLPIALGNSLHLKTAVTALDGDTLLLNPQWIDPARFADYATIEVAPEEPFGANVLALDDSLIVNAACPRTLELVSRHAEHSGKRLVPVDISEFGKAEAGLTCLSLIVPDRKSAAD